MMEQERIEQERIEQMEIDFPPQDIIDFQINKIVDMAIEPRLSIWEKIKKIYWGPGLKTIYRQSGSTWCVTLMIYIALCFICRSYSTEMDERLAISFVAFPICFLTFSFLSCYLEEQECMCELKASLHYSLHYIVALRLLYGTALFSVLNTIMLATSTGLNARQVISVGCAGNTSMLLYAFFAVAYYHRYSKSNFIGIMCVVWAVFAFGVLRAPAMFQAILLEYIPVGVNVLMFAGCFIGLLVLIGRMERKDAYSFAC